MIILNLLYLPNCLKVFHQNQVNLPLLLDLFDLEVMVKTIKPVHVLVFKQSVLMRVHLLLFYFTIIH